MASETYKYTFKRWSLRGKSDRMSITAMPAMTTLAYDRMAAASWLELSGTESDLPCHDCEQVGAWVDTYDAAKFCTDYAEGKQYAFACAACYTIKIPAEARAGTKAKVEAIAATVYGDRWLGEGAILSAFLTDSETPPAWADIVDGSTALASSPDPAPAADAVTVPDWKAPLRRITRSKTLPDNDYAATLTAATATDATAYLHVVIRLSDYISLRQISATDGGTRDSAWIEGAAKIDGTTLTVQFDRAVTPDAQDTILLLDEYPASATNWFGHMGGLINNYSAVALKYNTSSGFAPTDTGDVNMMRRLLEMREYQSISQIGNIGGSAAAENVVNLQFDAGGGWIGIKYSAPTGYAVYKLCGMLMTRPISAQGQTAQGVSFDQAIPTLPAGQTVRIAVYAHPQPIPPAFTEAEARLQCNIFTMASAADPLLCLGDATAITYGYIGTGSISSDAGLTYGPVSAACVPLGHVDLPGGAGFAAGTQVSFDEPYVLPRYCVIVVAINVIEYTSAWVAAPQTSTAVQFKPSDLSLHVV